MTWLQAIVAVLGAIRDFFSWKKSADDRQAGRDAAGAETLGKNAEAVTEANRAEIEAKDDHRVMPGDEAFDQDFRRRD